MDPSPEHQRLIRKLCVNSPLGEREQSALAALPMELRSVSAGQDIVCDGDRPSVSCVAVEGFFFRYKALPDGQRQILAINIPGEIPDLQSLYLKVMDHTLAAFTAGRIATVRHADLLPVIERFPKIAAALWRETLVDAAIFREWVTNVGRRTGRQRLAHLLCELYLRLDSVGLTRDCAFELPITQAELADATGLSSVHVNRVLQELRRDALIASKGRWVEVLDWPGLQAAAEFDRSYLHFVSDDRP